MHTIRIGPVVPRLVVVVSGYLAFAEKCGTNHVLQPIASVLVHQDVEGEESDQEDGADYCDDCEDGEDDAGGGGFGPRGCLNECGASDSGACLLCHVGW